MKSIAKKKKKSKEKLKKERKQATIMMKLIGFVITVGFVAVIVNLSYIIFVKGNSYKKAAYSQQTKSQIISSNRGTIYDVNGEPLAVSVSVDTVSINPNKVKYGNGKNVAPEDLARNFF